MPRWENTSRSEIDRIREEYGLVRDIETKAADPFEEAMADYNGSKAPSQISESATRLIQELQEMRRKKEETQSSQKRLAASSRFDPRIIEEDQQSGKFSDYSIRSKARESAQDIEFGETLSAFAESARMTFYSTSSSSKTPGSSSAGTVGTGAQATMHLFGGNDSSAYASSSATGTTNAPTLSSETYTKGSSSSKDPSIYVAKQTPAISSTTLISSISSGFDYAPEPSTLVEMTK